MHSPRLQYEAVRSLSRITPCRGPRASALNTRPRGTARPASWTHSRVFSGFRKPATTSTAVLERDEEDVAILDEKPQSQHPLSASKLQELLRLEKELVREAEEEGIEYDTQPVQPENYEEETYGIGQKHTATVEAILANGTFENAEEAQQAVLKAINNKASPHDILFTFFRATHTPGYNRAILRTWFLEDLLEAIKPDVSLLPLRQVHGQIHPSTLSSYYGYSTLEQISAVYFEIIELLLLREHEHTSETFAQAPHLLRILLEAAKVCGYHQHARLAFTRLKANLGEDLDIDAYNSLLEAICWAGAFGPQRFMLRVTPGKLQARNNYTSGTEGYRAGSGGLRDEVLQIFEELADDGLSPTAATYNNLMIGCAREGDLDSVKFVLRNTWNFDCDEVLRRKHKDPVKELEDVDPLYPTQDTLFAIAHCFSINNDVPTAVRVVDLFSAMYNIEIDVRTWTELMEWAFVLSTPRRGANTSSRHRKRRADQLTGHLPYSVVSDLWNIMSAPPFNVPFDMTIVNFLVKTCVRRHAIPEAVRYMLEGDRVSLQSRQNWSQKQQEIDQGGFEPRHQVLRDDLVALRAARDRTTMHKLLRYVLGGANAYRFGSNASSASDSEKARWFYRTLPDITLRFWRYRVPAGNSYEHPTGRVQFHPCADGMEASITLSSRPAPSGRRLENLRHLTLEQSPSPPNDLDLYTALTRQEKLQIRYRKREVTYGDAPQWMPMWHEADNVADWDPVDKVRLLYKPEKVEDEDETVTWRC